MSILLDLIELINSLYNEMIGLIEDLGSETERVDVKIQRETRRIEKTTRKSGNISKAVVCMALIGIYV